MVSSEQIRSGGFTLIEMLVVMTALGLLLSIAAPRYFEQVSRSREVVLKHNLAVIRQAIDRFKGDRGRYPAEMMDLVKGRYLREVPLDPVNERSDAWVLSPAQDQSNGIVDVHSGAVGNARDGSAYAAW